MERASKGIVVDASVAAKWFMPEEDSDKASKILREYADGRIEIPFADLLIYEVANVMRCRPDINGEALAGNTENLLSFSSL
ncbi:MAG: type II toxin-antitoxin system VapC family toxin [Candidatus Bathyarchaeia archaeon]|nr:type II toxin-antitoxin system VapC family toxin [Candidatus Bathyarchaeota archaeon]